MVTSFGCACIPTSDEESSQVPRRLRRRQRPQGESTLTAKPAVEDEGISRPVASPRP